MSIHLSKNGIVIDNVPYPLYSGSIRYWRHDKSIRGKILDSIIELGFRFICTEIPWEIHETGENEFDFTGNRNVGKFLEECRQRNLFVLIRPGPYNDAGLKYFGFPCRILLNPRFQARTSLNTIKLQYGYAKQAAVPTYAADELYTETGTFYKRLYEEIKTYLYPSGPVVGVYADCGSTHFLDSGAFDLDYCESSIRLYHSFLQSRYSTIDQLNGIYHSSYKTFTDIIPPKACTAGIQISELPYYLDWVRYKEYLVTYSVRKCASLLKKYGFNTIPILTGYPGPEFIPSLPSANSNYSEIDLPGITIHPDKENLNNIKKTAKLLCGCTFLPFAAELGTGTKIDYQKPFSFRNEEFKHEYIFMHGTKAAVFYLTAECEQWQGAPITRVNAKRKFRFNHLQNLLATLQNEEFFQFDKQTGILFLVNTDYNRYKKANTANSGEFPPLPDALFNLPDPVDLQATESAVSGWIQSVESLLSKYGLDYNIAKSDQSSENLSRYHTVIYPACDFIPDETVKAFTGYRNAGGTLIFGPISPYLNENCAPSDLFKNEFGFDAWPSEQIERHFTGLSQQNRIQVDNSYIETAEYIRNNQILVSLANNTESPINLSFVVKDAEKLRNWFTGEILENDNGFSLFLPGFTVCFLEVINDQ